MKMSLSKEQMLQLVMAFVPAAIANGVADVETAVLSNADKKTKAVAIATSGLSVLNQLAGSDLAGHPKFVEAIGKVNDALVYAARTATAIHSGELPPLPPAPAQ